MNQHIFHAFTKAVADAGFGHLLRTPLCGPPEVVATLALAVAMPRLGNITWADLRKSVEFHKDQLPEALAPALLKNLSAML